MNKVLLASICFALVVPVSPCCARQLNDGDVLAPSRTAIMEKLAQMRGFSASGTHQCGSSDKSRSCIVTGSGFGNCKEASTVLETRDCCPITPKGGKSSGFVLNYCIPDRPL